MSRSAETAILTLVVAAGTWPWLGELWRWPMTPDAVTWIERAALGPDWLDWTFLSSHFEVGWRPLTALSFTADRMLVGLEPWLYRGTDVALHALVAWLAAASVRRLAPELPAWSRWLAALIFLAHPVAEEVVPFLARRSYSLATVLSLAAVVVYLKPPADDARRPRETAFAAGALLALAVSANEVAVLVAAALPFLWRARCGAQAAACSWSSVRLVVPVIAVLAARTAVVGGLGGYEPEEGAGGGAIEVFNAAWLEIGGVARAPGAAAATIGALALLYYGWRALAERGLALVLALWVAAHPLLYAGQGVWFPRQAYVATAPLALLVAVVAANTWKSRRGWARAAHLAPQVAFIGIMLSSSPLLRGPDPERSAERRACQAIIDGALADLGHLGSETGPAVPVNLVLPFAPQHEREDVLRAQSVERELTRTSRLPARWLALYLADRGVAPREFVYVFDEQSRGEPLAVLSEDGRTLSVRDGCVYYVAQDDPDAPGESDGDGRMRLSRRDAAASRAVTVPAGRLWIAGGS